MQNIQVGDLVSFKGSNGYMSDEEPDVVGLVTETKLAVQVYRSSYDEDDEGKFLWLGEDDVVHTHHVMCKILWSHGHEWIQTAKLLKVE